MPAIVRIYNCETESSAQRPCSPHFLIDVCITNNPFPSGLLRPFLALCTFVCIIMSLTRLRFRSIFTLTICFIVGFRRLQSNSFQWIAVYVGHVHLMVSVLHHPHCHITSAPNASANRLTARLTSPRSPMTVSFTSAFTTLAPCFIGVRSCRPKAQFTICIPDGRRMYPFTRHTDSLDSDANASESTSSRTGAISRFNDAESPCVVCLPPQSASQAPPCT